ncbi:hypothetical protein GGS21DRAFT_487994 [Xylaria nigripes]|nr:hypothetical protein GGS21DRAFT_487994 [Xylaria nigripes]
MLATIYLSAFLLTVVAVVPFLAVAELVTTLDFATSPGLCNSSGVEKQQSKNACCTVGCGACSKSDCTTARCSKMPYISCCAVERTRVFDDGTVEDYNEEGVKIEYFSIPETDADEDD